MPKAIGYIRQSLDQKRQENSEAYQYDALHRYHKGRKIQLDSWPRDIVFSRDIDVSGRTVPFFERQGGAEIRRLAQKGDIIVVHKMDRMGRNAQDLVAVADYFQEHGVAIHLLDMMGMQIDTLTAAGRFMLQVLAASCEFEANRTSERTCDALAVRRRAGLKISRHPPHCKKFVTREGEMRQTKDGRLVPKVFVEDDWEMVAALDRAFQMHANHCTLHYISAYFNVHGPKHPTGKPWCIKNLSSMMVKERKLRQRKAVA